MSVNTTCCRPRVTFVGIYPLKNIINYNDMEHYYQFAISVRPLPHDPVMFTLYSCSVLLPEIRPFNTASILKTATAIRFVNGCLQFSKLSNSKVEYVATCCKIGSSNRIEFHHQRPNVPLL